MKICVYGAGAIGGYLALMLKRGGCDVSIVARGEHLAAIRANGLSVETGGKTLNVRVPATDDPAELGPQDCVIVGLKAHQAWTAAAAMGPLFGPFTSVVTAQNGVPWWYFYGLEGVYANRRLASVDPGNRQWDMIGPERVIGCTIYPAAERTRPGVIRHAFGQRFGLGEPNCRRTDRLKQLNDAFAAAALQPRLFDDIREDIWPKLWGNMSFNPISALTRATLGVMAVDPATRRLARDMMLEAQIISAKLGVKLRIDVEDRLEIAAKAGPHRTSMLQDLDNDRPLEIDALIGAVQEMGRLVGVETPYIDAVLGLVQQLGRNTGLYPVFPA